jgi:hypothetical protein
MRSKHLRIFQSVTRIRSACEFHVFQSYPLWCSDNQRCEQSSQCSQKIDTPQSPTQTRSLHQTALTPLLKPSLPDPEPLSLPPPPHRHRVKTHVHDRGTPRLGRLQYRGLHRAGAELHPRPRPAVGRSRRAWYGLLEVRGRFQYYC